MDMTKQVNPTKANGGGAVAEVPKYRRILDDLRGKIADGSLAPGAKLSSEKELAEQHGVAIETVRRALKALVQEGVIEQIHGRGTFVREFRPILRDASKRLSKQQWGTGRAIWEADLGRRKADPDDVRVVVAEAPEWVADILGVSRVVVRDRKYVVEKRPVQRAVAYLPAEIAEGTAIAEPDTGDGGTYARLMDLGFEPTHFRERVRVRMPSAEEAQDLDLGPGRPVAEIVREAATESGRVVEVQRMILVGDAYVFQWSFTS